MQNLCPYALWLRLQPVESFAHKAFVLDFYVLNVGERSNFKKIPTHMQDHGDA